METKYILVKKKNYLVLIFPVRHGLANSPVLIILNSHSWGLEIVIKLMLNAFTSSLNPCQSLVCNGVSTNLSPGNCDAAGPA